MESTGGKAKREIFIWKQTHEDFLLREILVVEPHQFRVGSKERGAAWTTIANNLTELGMKVIHRAVRERFDKILNEFKQKELKEEQASGVDVEYTERAKNMTDIVERIQECDLAADSVKGKEKKERATAGDEKTSD